MIVYLYVLIFVESLSIQDKGLTKAQKLFGICGTSRESLRLRIQITRSGGSHQSFSAMGSGVLQLLGGKVLK